eukprot:gene6634-13441_t
MAGIPMRKYSNLNFRPGIHNMRSVVGSGARHLDMENALNECPTNLLHCAVNVYFRIFFSSQNPIAHRNYVISLPKCDNFSHINCVISSKLTTTIIPGETWHQILAYCNAYDLLSFSSVNKYYFTHILSDHPNSQSLWKSLLIQSGYELPQSNPNSYNNKYVIIFKGNIIMNGYEENEFINKTNKQQKNISIFREFYLSERNGSCPFCTASETMLPVVYGFPSNALIHARSLGLLLMGGDGQLQGAAAWACKQCHEECISYPWKYVVMSLID